MKYLYHFNEGNKDMKDLLGGKGANLAEMTNLDIPVPPGFTLTTELCINYLEEEKLPDDFDKQLHDAIDELNDKNGKVFGDPKNPLFVSVRSGARISMPGMMDTVLNLGLNRETLDGLIKLTGNERFGWDSYRRFISIYSDVVMGIKAREFTDILDKLKEEKGYEFDTDLSVDDLKWLVDQYFALLKSKNIEFPEDPYTQLKNALLAVFDSWNIPRAITYRRINHLSDDMGTACNVQTMVFGNMSENSATGVAFSRNPSTGEDALYGEYLKNAQGEDVVAGIRTPHPIAEMKNDFPENYDDFYEIAKKLEKHYKEVQDMEFTVQEGTLYVLQTRTGKRTASAAVKIAYDLTKEGLINEKEALLSLDPQHIEQLLHKRIDDKLASDAKELFAGLPASPGAVTGQIVFTPEEAVVWKKDGKKVILVRLETSPDDIEGMNVAEGIVTARGGMTSHAAVVARSMGKCCIAGCSSIEIHEDKKEIILKDGTILHEGEFITADGSLGKVFEGKLELRDPEMSGEFKEILSWADKYRTLGVRANADTPIDTQIAKDFGAEGIGLARTEHMFFKKERLIHMRQMILSETKEERVESLNALLKMQQADYEGIFEIMHDKPLVIRLLDPPLHEFLPKEEDEQKELAEMTGKSIEEIKQAVVRLSEVNPMLGHRGCRLGITYPEVYLMQVEAMLLASKKTGFDLKYLEVELPLIGLIKEYTVLKDAIREHAVSIVGEEDANKFPIGTMIELPRACLIADELAKVADFFSFGTNDLTQTTFGFSRDDANKFISIYLEDKVLDRDPFQTLDVGGVGQLINMTVEKSRSTVPGFEIGICGEHGGDPASIEFFHNAGLNYISCSPFRVPIARIAAAQAALRRNA